MSTIKRIFFLLFIATVAVSADWMQKCGLCHCKWNSGKKMADCRNSSLVAIPTEMSSELQVIDFSNNQIAELHRNEFLDAELENVHKLFMRNCTMQEINRDAFKGLRVLIELDLSYNHLRVLHPGTFAELTKLRTVNLNNNEIETIEDFLFDNLPFLYKIELISNRLHHIGLQAFVNVDKMSSISLDSNRLTVLKAETFRGLDKLMSLSLSGNLWNCTCDLLQFQKYVIHNKLYTPPTMCVSPEKLATKLWPDVPHEDFACKPRVYQPRPGTIVESTADNVNMTCRVRGSPKPDVQWTFQSRPINTKDPRISIVNSQEINRRDSVDIYTSELKIVGVRSSDIGTYVCKAVNTGGDDAVEMQLIVPTPAVNRGAVANTPSNMLLIICMIAIILLSILIIIGLVLCCYCRRVKKFSKNGSLSENGLVSGKIMDKSHPNSDSMLEGSVIMEMQKSLLTEVNPVEKPPRRAELDSSGDLIEDGHELKKTLLDETTFGHQDEETQSISLSDTTARSRTTFIDDGYGTNLPPDLLAFPSRFPQSPSLQSSISNIQDHHLYATKSPPMMASPIYQHNPHVYPVLGPNSGFRTLQLPKGRNMSAAVVANRSQSPFTPAPIIYPVIMKQGYVTIPRKPRTPSWTPSLASTLTDFPPTSPTMSSAMSPDLVVEPVYDNLGLRTTASGNSVLNLNKIGGVAASATTSVAAAVAAANQYSMKDRPLPATPRTPYEVIQEATMATEPPQQQQHYKQVAQKPQMAQPLSLSSLMDHQQLMNSSSNNSKSNDDTEALYSRSTKTPTIVSNNGNEKLAKVPPRPPPKPKKKSANGGGAVSNGGDSSTQQLFEDECEDGTEV